MISSQRAIFLIRLYAHFILTLPIVTMYTYTANGRRHAVDHLTNIKVGT